MGPVLTPAPPQAAQTRLGRNIAVAAIGGLAALALILGMLRLVQGPAVIQLVTINNPTPYPVEVSIAGASGAARVDLGSVSPGSRQAFESVVDQGDRWVVHVTSASSDGGEFVARRHDLQRANWVIRIPDAVGAKLADNGATTGSQSD
jgi:Tfp pilus assembly protein FimV